MADMRNKAVFYSCSLFLLALPALTLADIDSATRAYEQGDYATALAEFARLAGKGDARAQYNLAFMYYGGDGVEQDYKAAFHWFEKSAKSGYSRAQDILGYMYSHGYGVTADRVRAYVWYSLAAANGVFLADEVRDGLAAEMGRAERAEAEFLTREYFKKYLNFPLHPD